MSSVTIRPNGTGAIGTGYSTNAATHHAGLSDQSDATRTQYNNGSPASDLLYQTMADVALPAGSVVNSVMASYRRGRVTAVGSSTFSVLIMLDSNGSSFRNEVSTTYSGGGTVAIANESGTAKTTTPRGAAWTQAEVNGMQLLLRDGGSPGTGPQWEVYEVWADVSYSAPPTTPTSVTVPAQPREDITVTWTHNSPDGLAQSGFQVKIFTAAVIAGGGFDANTSSNVFDSGDVASGTSSYTADANLSPGHYSAYVRTKDATTGAYGPWGASNDFRILNSPLMMV